MTMIDASQQQVALLDEVTIGQPQAEHIIQHLPQLHPGITTILTAIGQARITAEEKGLPDLIGHGAHGEYQQAVELVKPTDVYVDRRYYTMRDYDAELDEEGQAWEDLLALADGDRILAPGTSTVAQSDSEVALVLDRPRHPNESGPRLMLIRGYPAWKLARHFRRPMRVVVMPDMPDYHVHDVSLRLALRESAAQPWEVATQLIFMAEDMKWGRFAARAPKESLLTTKKIATLLRCCKRDVMRVRAILQHPASREYLLERKLPARQVAEITAATTADPTVTRAVLEEAAKQKLTVEQSVILAQDAVQTGYIVPDYTPQPGQNPVGASTPPRSKSKPRPQVDEKIINHILAARALLQEHSVQLEALRNWPEGEAGYFADALDEWLYGFTQGDVGHTRGNS